MRKPDSGKVLVGAVIILTVIFGALLAGLTVTSLGERYSIGDAPASAASKKPARGKVLIAGGYGSHNRTFKSTELYDPATNGFAAADDTSIMSADQPEASATLLLSGEVLIAGGNVANNTLASTELYDPTTNSFSANSAVMNVPRYLMTATLLPSGQVLITGGFLSVNNPDGSGYDMLLASTELYDPTSNSFAAPADTATMNFARFADTATLLPTGKVLIAGGVGIVTFMASTELYDPTSNTFAAPADTATMNAARYDATATLLPSGEVLIAGGCCGGSGDIRLASTELYDPVTNSFAAAANAAAMNVSRENATATLLLSGQVLIAGGLGDNSVVLASTELYDPTTNTFAPAADTATMNEARYLATATLLPSGEVLITGGLGGDGSVLASTELYDPLTNSFAAPADTATMNVARRSALTVLLPGAATPTATPTPSGEITLLPPTVDFGTVTVGQASPASTVTLSNGTGKQIKIKGFATGGDYKVVSTTCSSTLNAGQSCNYMLSFRPQRAGTKNEAFRVTVTGTSLKVKLHGVGTRR